MMSLFEMLNRDSFTDIIACLQKDYEVVFEGKPEYAKIPQIVCVDVYGDRSDEPFKTAGKINVLKHLPGLAEFRFGRLDASRLDWTGFDDLPLQSIVIWDYEDISNPMIIPATTQHLRFDGLRGHLHDVDALATFFAKAFANISPNLFDWTFGGGESGLELREEVFDKARSINSMK